MGSGSPSSVCGVWVLGICEILTLIFCRIESNLQRHFLVGQTQDSRQDRLIAISEPVLNYSRW